MAVTSDIYSYPPFEICSQKNSDAVLIYDIANINFQRFTLKVHEMIFVVFVLRPV